MGVTGLWQVLKEAGFVSSFSSAADGGLVEAVNTLRGLVVSVDLSIWIVQAVSQPALQNAGFSDKASIAKVCFERCVNYLRLGVTPVGVLEGNPPLAKIETLARRTGGRYGVPQLSRLLRSYNEVAASVFEALGLPVVQAAGEGEATAAALNALGFVDAVASEDVDSLLFGARRVFKELELTANNAKKISWQHISASTVGEAFHLNSSGAELFTALALLSGGDYDPAGVERVGSKTACVLVGHLLTAADRGACPHPAALEAEQRRRRAASGGAAGPSAAAGGRSDQGLVEALLSVLRSQPEEELEALHEAGCNGCRRCRHPGPWKQPGAKHSKAGCAGCGTLASLGGCGGCVEKPKNTPCECEYHRFEGARAVDKAIRKAATSLPKTLEAARTYESQRRAAAGACRAAAAQYGVAAGERLAWMQRPSVDDLFAVMEPLMSGHLMWELEGVRRKLLPLLLCWDLQHPRDAAARFRAISIKSASCRGAGKRSEEDEDGGGAGGSDGVYYVLEWAARAGLPGCPTAEEAEDLSWLAKQPAQHRSALRWIVDESAPQLAADLQKRLQEKEDAAAAKLERAAARAEAAERKKLGLPPAKKAGAGGGKKKAAAAAGSDAAPGPQRTLMEFFQAGRSVSAGTGGTAGGKGDPAGVAPKRSLFGGGAGGGGGGAESSDDDEVQIIGETRPGCGAGAAGAAAGAAAAAALHLSPRGSGSGSSSLSGGGGAFPGAAATRGGTAAAAVAAAAAAAAHAPAERRQAPSSPAKRPREDDGRGGGESDLQTVTTGELMGFVASWKRSPRRPAAEPAAAAAAAPAASAEDAAGPLSPVGKRAADGQLKSPPKATPAKATPAKGGKGGKGKAAAEKDGGAAQAKIRAFFTPVTPAAPSAAVAAAVAAAAAAAAAPASPSVQVVSGSAFESPAARRAAPAPPGKKQERKPAAQQRLAFGAVPRTPAAEGGVQGAAAAGTAEEEEEVSSAGERSGSEQSGGGEQPRDGKRGRTAAGAAAGGDEEGGEAEEFALSQARSKPAEEVIDLTWSPPPRLVAPPRGMVDAAVSTPAPAAPPKGAAEEEVDEVICLS